MFYDDEIDKLFKRMSRSFMNLDDVFEGFRETGDSKSYGPFYYGYTMTIGPDGKPVVKEYGNVKPGLLPTSDAREPLVDTLIDEKEKVLKLFVNHHQHYSRVQHLDQTPCFDFFHDFSLLDLNLMGSGPKSENSGKKRKFW